MRCPLLITVALLGGCSLPVDEFKAPSSESEQKTESPIAGRCDGAPKPNREITGHCYFMATGGKLKADAATNACTAIRGAHLATIGADEHATVTALVQQLATDAWIGLRAASDVAEFRWIDGETDAFRAWRPDYPKEGAGLCVITKKDGRWENRKCEDDFPALCEL